MLVQFACIYSVTIVVIHELQETGNCVVERLRGLASARLLTREHLVLRQEHIAAILGGHVPTHA